MEPLERAVQIYAVVNFAVIGVSHAMRPRDWLSFFALLRERGEAGVFAVAFPTLAFGSVVVAFHNVWSGIPLVLTLLGWAHVAKALVYFAFPSFALRKLQLSSRARPGSFVAAGVICLLLAVLLGYDLIAA
jgi:hypothetical protein